jgi:hypothetical protein
VSTPTTPAQPSTTTTPGLSPPTYDPRSGLLGAPATNPIVIQAEQQERVAAEAAAAAAQAAANAQAEAATTGSSAAASPEKYNQIDFRTNAFTRPEIPTIFLNIAS